MLKLKYFADFVNEALKTKEIDPKKFPDPANKNDDTFFAKGKQDGNAADDVVDTRMAGIPAKSLKPSQDAVYLGKALGLAIAGVAGGELGAIISKDNRILDGHHRWAATLFNNPSAKIIGSKADMVIGDLVPVLRQAGDALGNERGTMPSGGDVNIFHATMKDVEDCIYRGMNMDPKFFDKDKAIAWFEKNKDSVEKGLNLIQRNGPPAGAPPRQDMPKIEPEQVDKVAKDLSAGKIDTRFPYVKEDSAFGSGMMFGIPGPGPKQDRKPIPSKKKFAKGSEPNDMKNILTFEQFIEEDTILSFESYISESELNELALTSVGVKGLLQAIYYNWDQIKDQIKSKYYMTSFRDIIAFIKGGDQEEQRELEVMVKDLGIDILDLDNKKTWGIK